MSYGKALKVIAAHWRDMYRIGKINNKNGVPYWSFRKGYRFLQQFKKILKNYKKEILR